MTDRERLMIQEYLPNPPDPTLDVEEFYFLQNNRVIRVYALDCLPHKHDTCYGIYKKQGGHLVHVNDGWDDTGFHGVYRHELYDNKEDCKNQTHSWCDNWEYLRELQQKEMAT